MDAHLNTALLAFAMNTITGTLPSRAADHRGTIEGIQVLRAVAALMVVMHHARHSVPGSQAWPAFGAAGVDIFFVISGFVMALTTVALRDGLALRLRAAAAGVFLRKRIARVVPLYWLAILWTARRDLAQGAVGLDLVKDVVFIPHPNATYPDMLWPLVKQGWTLNYEMFFYALFAGSLLLARFRTVALLCGLVLLVVLGAALRASGWPADAPGWLALAQRFYTDDLLLEFGYGVMLQRFVASRRPPAWPRAVFAGLAVAGFVLMASGYGLAPRAFLQGLPALLIVWAGLHACRGLRAPLLERVADASYAIYLFHWASFGAVKPVAGWIATHMPLNWPAGLQVGTLMGLHIAVAIVSGLIIHRAIERPLLHWAQRGLGLGSVRSAAAPHRTTRSSTERTGL